MTKPTGPEPHDSVEAHSKLFRDLLLGFVRIHVLHHASKEPIYGAGIWAELENIHGYRLSWGTLYPLLHNLDAAGFLQREERIVAGKVRKYYRITPLGHRALHEARSKAIELVQEITESGGARAPSTSGRHADDARGDDHQPEYDPRNPDRRGSPSPTITVTQGWHHKLPWGSTRARPQ